MDSLFTKLEVNLLFFMHYFDWFCKIPFLTEFLIIWASLMYLFCCFFINTIFWKTIWITQLQKILKETIVILSIINLYILIISNINLKNKKINHEIHNNILDLNYGLFCDTNLIHNFYTITCKTILLLLIYTAFKQWLYFINKNKNIWNSINEFPYIFLGSSFFLLILFSINNLFLTIFIIIGMSICFYILLAINAKFGKLAMEACIKYYILSALSTGLILGGIKEIYATCGTANFNAINDIYILLSANTDIFSKLFIIKYGMLFIFAGFLFKLSAAPNHFWAPEIYEGLPYALINFIILPVKFAIGFIFLRIFKIVFTIFAFNEFDNFIINNEIEIFIIITIIASMLIGGLNATFEQKLKRFIAYSSINQIGFLFIGMLGLNSSLQGLQSFIYFFFIYVINLTLFLNIILFFTKYEYYWFNEKTTMLTESTYNLIYLTDLKKIFYTEYYKIFKTKNMYTKIKITNIKFNIILLIMILFSLAGLPPLLGFFGKFYILLYALKLNYIYIILIGIIISIISVYYYLRFLKIIFFEEFIKFENKIKAYQFITNFLELKYINIQEHLIYQIALLFLLITPIFIDELFLTNIFKITQSFLILLN